MLEGDSVNWMLERQEIAKMFCDEDGQNWGSVVVQSLGRGEAGKWCTI